MRENELQSYSIDNQVLVEEREFGRLQEILWIERKAVTLQVEDQ